MARKVLETPVNQQDSSEPTYGTIEEAQSIVSKGVLGPKFVTRPHVVALLLGSAIMIEEGPRRECALAACLCCAPPGKRRGGTCCACEVSWSFSFRFRSRSNSIYN